MKVREFITRDVDMDVYSDYSESLGIAFVYGYGLTEEGQDHFKEALELNVEIDEYDNVATVHCENGRESKKACEFFEAIAGYCSCEDFDRWFVDIE